MPSEEDAKAELVLNTELVKKMLWNGSKRNMMEQSIIDLYKIFKLNIHKLLYLSHLYRYKIHLLYSLKKEKDLDQLPV